MITTALLLTAGLGTRLGPLGQLVAKPALPVAGEPMVRRIIAWLQRAGVTDVVLNLHHQPESITAVVGDGSDLGVRARYSWEQPRVLGSAGGPRRALDILGTDRFLIVNGDTLTEFDLAAFASAHEATGAHATLALVPNTEPDKYGGVHLDAEGRVVGFSRRGPTSAGSCHFVGVQAVEAAVFSELGPDVPASTIGGVYDQILAQVPGAIRGHLVNATFFDVGTAADYLATCLSFAGCDATGSDIAAGAQIAPGASVTRSVVWPGAIIGERAVIDQCIITGGARVPSEAHLSRLVVAPRERAAHIAGLRIDGDLAVAPLAG